MATQGDDWERYGRALHRAMGEVLTEFPEEVRAHALETADYWLSLGLAIGIQRPADAPRLLGLIEANQDELSELSHDATAFVEEVLG